MSNTMVGSVYHQIIADVIESSRVDFEEGGVDESVLDELRKGWQQKLSQLQVATFPWDPKPEPPQLANAPTVPSNANIGSYQPLNPQPHAQAPYIPQNHSAGPRIKPEPGLEDSIGGQPPQYPQHPPPILPPSTTTAQQRAAGQLQAHFGDRAAASIHAIQGSMSQQHQQQQQNSQNMQQIPQQHSQQAFQQQQQQQAAYNARMQQSQQAGMNGGQGSVNGGQPQSRQMSEAQYRHAMAQQAAQAQQRLQAQNAQNGVGGAQTDGGGDDILESVSVIKRMDANGEEIMGRVEIDNLIREKIAAMGQTMEGGGLMLPLHQATNSQKRLRKVKKSRGNLGQHDGPGGSDDDDNKDGVKDEELDEDAINSDLDDPDDGLNDDEDDDEGMGHIMLCMYDKVQRVKNKWKCVMKDGVLTVNGKEYVFHKASGEYEW